MADNSYSLEMDTVSRNRIVSETDMNFFVEAGAGSGKTTMLVNRMVAMVEQGKDISKICAITFTKAAAGEFYERFQKVLAERSNPNYEYEDSGHAGQLPPPTEESRKRCAEALRNIDLCFMGTIDSFCNMILSEHPSEAKIPSDAIVASKEAMDALYKQEYVKICKGEYGSELAKQARAFKSLNKKAEDAFVKGMSILLDNRHAHMNYNEMYVVDIDNMFAAERLEIFNILKILCKSFGSYLAKTNYLYEYRGKMKKPVRESLMRAYNVLQMKWSNHFSDVIYNLGTLCKIEFPKEILNDGLYKEKYWKLIGKKEDKAVLTFDLDNGLMDRLEEARYHISMTFLAQCIPVVEKAKRDKGYMTFFDYLFYLRNMLKQDAMSGGKLIRYIYERHSYYLIDEFQDTNPMQAEIFFYLASANPVPEWRKCIPQKGSLFIVGDPKQSIYRFRCADVSSYLKVKKLFEDVEHGDVLYLSRNFRSGKVLREYFNAVFSKTLKESDMQSAYTPIPIDGDKHKEFEGVYKYDVYIGKLAQDNPDKADVVQVGKIIQTIVDNENYKITTKGDAVPRKINYDDIMIIVYGKSRLEGMVEYLTGLEIPLRVEGKVLFDSNEALIEVSKIYNALADSADSTALYGALTGKIFGITSDEVLEYHKEGGIFSLQRFTQEDCLENNQCERMVVAMTKLKEMSKQALKLSPAAVFDMILEELEVYRYVAAKNMEVLCYTQELLRTAEKDGKLVMMQDVCNFLGKLLSQDTEEERCLSLSNDKKCVHLANLHKVKGLEAPVVILAYAWPTDIPPELRIEYQEDTVEGYAFAINSDETWQDGFAKIPFLKTISYAKEYEKEKLMLTEERKRLVYVAATRARNVLFIADSMYKTWDAMVHRSLWKDLLDHCEQDFFEVALNNSARKKAVKRLHQVCNLYEQAVQECALVNRDVEAESYQIATPSHSKVASKTEEDYSEEHSVVQEDNPELLLTEAHECPALLGTVVHRLMEIMISTKVVNVTEEVISHILNEHITPATEQYRESLRTALQSVAAKMSSGGYVQNNGLSQDVVGTLLSADEVYTEVPFCYKDTDGDQAVIWHGVMDVIYSENGKWHILDYKTNADGSDLDETYKAQMQAYMKAFKAITGQDADAKTYHIAI